MPSGHENAAQSGHSGQIGHLRLTPANDPELGPLRPDSAPRDDLAALRARIGAIERIGGLSDGEGAGPLSLGAAVDAALPWGGLPRGCLHEIMGTEAAAGFAAGLAARLAGRTGAVLWCLRPRAVFDAGHLHGPGLTQFGLDPGRLIVAQARSDQDLLWAMEEGLRSGRPAAVLGEVGEVGLAASRRLQLAAEMGGVMALLLRRRKARRESSVAVTRWQVAPAPSGDALSSVWRVDLVRCRGGAPKSWLMEWHRAVPSGNTDDNANGTEDRCEGSNPAQAPDPGGFAVVAELSDRPAEPADAALRSLAS